MSEKVIRGLPKLLSKQQTGKYFGKGHSKWPDNWTETVSENDSTSEKLEIEAGDNLSLVQQGVKESTIRMTWF